MSDATPAASRVSPDGMTAAEASGPVFLGSAAATRRDQRLALAAAALLAVAFALTVPWADRPLRPMPAFALLVNAAAIVLDLITALLLFARYRHLGERSFLALACGYLFSPLLMAAHTLSFPGAFGPGGLIGGDQTTAWLWMGWHGLFPFFVIGYALLARRDRRAGAASQRPADRRTAALAVSGTVALAAAVVALATLGDSRLPELMIGDRYRSLTTQLVLAVGWSAHLVALGLLVWSTRLRRRIDLWVGVVLAALLIDLALSAVLISGRYQLGWYVGRAYGLLGAGFVLGVLLRESVALYGGAVGTAAALRESEAKYRALFESMDEAYAVVEVLADEAGRWHDFLFLEVNPAFVKHTGMEFPVGRTATQLLGNPNPRWAEICGRVAETGEPVRLKEREATLDRVFDLSVFRLGGPGSRRVAALFANVTERKRGEEALWASEERLRLILEAAADYAIFTLDEDRRVTTWSTGAESVFGYSQEEMLGKSGDLLFTPEDRAAGAPEEEARKAREEGRAEDERWHLRKDGSRFYASGVVRPLGGGPPGYVKVTRDLTERKRYEDELRQARDRLEAHVAERTAELVQANAARVELLRRLASAQEDERLRLSRELHDRLGQSLTALILGLGTFENRFPEASAEREDLRRLRAAADEAAREAHDLALRLRPTALDDVGLVAAVRNYVESWSMRTGITADLHAGLDARLPAEAETALYRVVQEALNNTLKHATASRVSVVLERRDGTAVTIVEDNGVGFEVEEGLEAARRRGRLGLLGMRERLAAVGGALEVESTTGGGTTVYARVPVGAKGERTE